MINRDLIRIRIVQIVYAWYQNSNNNLKNAEKELLFGFQKSYDLYYYLLLLMVKLTDMYENRIETKKNKFLPSEEDLHPNTHLIDNKFIRQLKTNNHFIHYLNNRPMSWEENENFVKNVLDNILESETYKTYSELENPTYDDDRDFWRKTFKQFIYNNEELNEILEDESIYWNDDVEIVQTFVLKTIKQFSEENGAEYRSLIEKHIDKWDPDRIAFMDMIIMQVAVAEIFSFESIPTRVTLNEYIEIAKAYSTPKSGSFVNGILDAIVNEIKKDNLIFKH